VVTAVRKQRRRDGRNARAAGGRLTKDERRQRHRADMEEIDCSQQHHHHHQQQQQWA